MQANAVTDAAGPCYGAVKIAPGWTFHDVFDDDPPATYTYVTKALSKRRIAYLQGGNYGMAWDVYGTLRPLCDGPLMAVAGFTRKSAAEFIQARKTDLVAFGQSYLANPDLPLVTSSVKASIARIFPPTTRKVRPVHAAMVSTRHVVSNIPIAVDGDVATSETYWTVNLRTRGAKGLVDIVGGGRYLHRLSCIGGTWAFRHRQSVHDWDRVDPAAETMSTSVAVPLIPPNHPEAKLALSTRHSSDPSYEYLKLQ